MLEEARALAESYELPDVEQVLWNLEFVASIICYQPERKTLREREREARRRLRANPNDKDARDELFSILAGRCSVVVDGTRRVMVDGEPKYVRYDTPNNKNRLSRDNVDHQIYAATYQLAALWEKCHGPIPLYDGTGKTESWRPNH